MDRYLILVLEGPLLAFGAEAVDARGPTCDWPGASQLTGLLANALGYRREDRADLAALQDRLSFAIRIDRGETPVRDFQTAKLAKNDKGWTTRGVPEGRDGGAATYDSPHIRERDFIPDGRVVVALTLVDAPQAAGAAPIRSAPSVDDLATALAEPARPLFIGRKPCLPSRPILEGVVAAADPLAALATVACEPGDAADRATVILPADMPAVPDGSDGFRQVAVTDRRNWLTGLHGGQTRYRRGPYAAVVPQPTQDEEPSQ